MHCETGMIDRKNTPGIDPRVFFCVETGRLAVHLESAHSFTAKRVANESAFDGL